MAGLMDLLGGFGLTASGNGNPYMDELYKKKMEEQNADKGIKPQEQGIFTGPQGLLGSNWQLGDIGKAMIAGPNEGTLLQRTLGQQEGRQKTEAGLAQNREEMNQKERIVAAQLKEQNEENRRNLFVPEAIKQEQLLASGVPTAQQLALAAKTEADKGSFFPSFLGGANKQTLMGQVSNIYSALGKTPPAGMDKMSVGELSQLAQGGGLQAQSMQQQLPGLATSYYKKSNFATKPLPTMKPQTAGKYKILGVS